MRSLPYVYNAVERFSDGEHNNVYYIKSVSIRRKR